MTATMRTRLLLLFLLLTWAYVSVFASFHPVTCATLDRIGHVNCDPELRTGWAEF